MRTIIAIVGLSGTGKDTAADYLVKSKGWNKIVSYTTRPKRNDESENSHIFVSKFDRMEKPFAYCQYGGYEYWTMWRQFKSSRPNIYVIDEKSLQRLKKSQDYIETIHKSLSTCCPKINPKILQNWERQRFRLVSVLINRPTPSVGIERTQRDYDRNIDPSGYDYVINNNGTLNELYSQLNNIQE